MEIILKNVTKKIGQNVILEDVNLTFESGKIYGLIGRNGSGKSVLLKMLCAFYEPTSGEILYDGVNIIKERTFPPRTRALIEKPNFLPDLTGYENLELLASIQNVIGQKEIEEALEMVDLLKEKDKKYHEYSLGMKQKLGIAQVLMEDVDVLILDEVFNGLDDASASKIRNIMLDEKKKGKTIILATHIREDIDSLCDVVYRLDGGHISQVS